MRLLLWPGDLVANWFGLPANSDHRQVLRSFVNTIFWGALGSIAVFVAVT